MITLLEFVEKKMRHTMPQLTDFDSFSADLKKEGHGLKQESVDPTSLKPTQKNFHQEKVDVLKKSGGWAKKPIIVSSDDHIIDGHHRWLAAKQLKKDIAVCRVDLTAEELFEFVKGKAYVKKKNLRESA